MFELRENRFALNRHALAASKRGRTLNQFYSNSPTDELAKQCSCFFMVSSVAVAVDS